MIADLDTHRLPVDADGYTERAGAAAVAHGVGDELSDKQLRVTYARCADQMQRAVEGREGLACCRRRLSAVGTIKP